MIRYYSLIVLLGLSLAQWSEGYAATPFSPASLAKPSPAVAPERTVYSVTTQDVEKMVSDALTVGGAGDQLQVTAFGDRTHPLASAYAPVKTIVQDVQFDAKSGRWNATLAFQADGSNFTPARVQGRYDTMTSVPMLSKTIDNGTRIDAEDIVMQPYPNNRVHKDTVLKAEDMIGKTPKRAIVPNRAIREDELTAASDIKKGAPVTLKYRTSTMLINTQGEALEPGSVGSRIRARNTTSKTVVSGILEEGNVVMVSAYTN